MAKDPDKEQSVTKITSGILYLIQGDNEQGKDGKRGN